MFDPHYMPREIVDKMYNKYFIHNFKMMLKYVDYDWVHPMDVKTNDHMVSWDNDPYLEKTKNERIKLGLDVLENGNYWPFTGDWGMNVSEGCHRIWSLQEVYKNIKKYEKRYLMFKHSWQFYYDFRKIQLDHTIEGIDNFDELYSTFTEYVYVPDKCIGEPYLKNTLEDKTVDKIDFGEFNLCVMECKNIYDIFLAYISIPVLMRYPLAHQEKIGKRVPSLPHMNDEGFFREWYSKR